jgi:hypothetical protein
MPFPTADEMKRLLDALKTLPTGTSKQNKKPDKP